MGNIQEGIMNTILIRRIKCKEMSKKFIKTIFRGVFHRQLKHMCKKRVGDNTVYGFGSRKISPITCDPGVQGDEGPKSQFLGKWGRRLGLHQT